MSDQENQEPAKRRLTDTDRYEREETTNLKDETPDQASGWPLHTRILLAMLLGVTAGVLANALVGGQSPGVTWVITNITEPAGQLFLRLLLMIVVPLVFSSLVVGVAAIGDVRKVGRVGLKAFVYTFLLAGLAIHMFGVYSLSVYFLSRIRPLEFFRRIKTVMLTAFSTSSSNATLPTALRVSEENLGVPREINSFVLTVGATANQNGTALYEGVTVLFLAQLSGIDLTIGQQIMVAYLAILGGIGTAGVPSGSIPFIVLVLATIGVNPSLIAIILGVDRILDMCRTTLNVTGDLTAATYVARSEGYDLLKTKCARRGKSCFDLFALEYALI